MCSNKRIGAVAALLLSTSIPIDAAWADPMPPSVDDLRSELIALKLEQQATDRRIEALEEKINELGGDGALNSDSRLPDSDAALMRGRGLGAYQASSGPSAAPPTSVPAADEESRKEPAKSAVVQAVTSSQQGYFGQHFSIEPGIIYSHFTNAQLNLNGFLALDAIFLGLISIDQLNADVVTTDVTARYGLKRLQFDVNVPYLYRRSNFRSGGAGGNASGLIERTVSSSGLGDISGGISYRLLAETAARPDVVVDVRAKAPTGRDPFGIELTEVEGSEGNLKIPSRLSTGSGVWSATAGISVLKTIDPMVVFGSLNYYHNFKHHFPDLSEALGDQPGEIRLGDSLQYGLGFAFALNDRTSIDTSFTQRFINHTKLRGDPAEDAEDTDVPWSTVVGSEANVASLNLGATFSLSDRLTLLSNLAIGISQDAPDMEFMLRIPYQF
ncbi:MAG TPA: hypothetical protein VH392_09995 [Sphingomicrobium sp.]|jgi:hypothetical protein